MKYPTISYWLLSATFLTGCSINSSGSCPHNNGDLTALIQNKDAALGSNPGEILITCGGNFSAPVVIHPHHVLRFGPGIYTSTYTGPSGLIRLMDHTAVIGSGWDTILHEPAAGSQTMMITPEFEDEANYYCQRYFDITVRDLQITGGGPGQSGGVSSIILGNVVNGYVDHVYFNFVGGIGVTMGGASAGPIPNCATNNPWSNHGENQWVTNCLFVGCNSQSISCINAKDIHIVGNTIREPNAVTASHGGHGIAAIDFEPNNPDDIIEGFDISNNLIDLRVDPPIKDARGNPVYKTEDGVSPAIGPSTSCTAIKIQPMGPNTGGPGIIENNTIIGATVVGGNTQGGGTWLTAYNDGGLFINANTNGIFIANNNIRLTLYAMTISGTNHVIRGNRFHDCGGFLVRGSEKAPTYIQPTISLHGTHCVVADNAILSTLQDVGSSAIIEVNDATPSPDYNQILYNYMDDFHTAVAPFPHVIHPVITILGAHSQSVGNVFGTAGP
jgi:hypothetical protein